MADEKIKFIPRPAQCDNPSGDNMRTITFRNKPMRINAPGCSIDVQSTHLGTTIAITCEPPSKIVPLPRGVLKEVAQQFGVDPSLVSRIASGKRSNSKIEQALKLAVRRHQQISF